jgi:hypothetical protein
MKRAMIPDEELGWFVAYEPNFKDAAVDVVKDTENIEIVEVFDFIDSLFVDGDETAVENLTDEEFINETQKEGVGTTL